MCETTSLLISHGAWQNARPAAVQVLSKCAMSQVTGRLAARSCLWVHRAWKYLSDYDLSTSHCQVFVLPLGAK